MAIVRLWEPVSNDLRDKSLLPCLHAIFRSDIRNNACQGIYTLTELILLKTYFSNFLFL